MWLQCEKERTEPGRQYGEPAWQGAETLRMLADVNEQCLELLIEEAGQRPTSGAALMRELGDLWQGLDAHSRRRAASCPYLLVDAGFADPYRWRWASEQRIGDREPAGGASFFTVPGLERLAHQVFSNAWYLVRMQPVGAPLFLGMPSPCAALLRACTMRQLTDLADRHASWVRPRWAGRAGLWRDLLKTAISGDGAALERARLRGVQLLASELRAAERMQLTERLPTLEKARSGRLQDGGRPA